MSVPQELGYLDPCCRISEGMKTFCTMDGCEIGIFVPLDGYFVVPCKQLAIMHCFSGMQGNLASVCCKTFFS